MNLDTKIAPKSIGEVCDYIEALPAGSPVYAMTSARYELDDEDIELIASFGGCPQIMDDAPLSASEIAAAEKLRRSDPEFAAQPVALIAKILRRIA